jgi:hypothetical protein
MSSLKLIISERGKEFLVLDRFKYRFHKELFCSTLSELENFLLCERILINVTTCQNETSNLFYRF